MLAPADAEVARRDAAVPGMALVLDAEALAARLSSAWPADGPATAVRVTYVRYKPGTSCLVGLELERPGGWAPAFAKAYRRDDGPKLAKARSQNRPGDVVTLDAAQVVVATAVGDRDLALPRRLASHGGHRLLRSLLPGVEDAGDLVARCIRYKPERRWVGVVERSGTPYALLKGYRGRELAGAAAGLGFAGTTSLAVPRLLATSGRAGALTSSWRPGEALSAVLARSPGERLLARVGRALAGLHRDFGSSPCPSPPCSSPPSGPSGEHTIERSGTVLATESVADDALAVALAAEAVGSLVPRLHGAADRLAGELGRRIVEGADALTPRHGDFTPDQLIWDGREIAFVDFDKCALGDPAADLGQFLAALEVGALDGGTALRAPGAAGDAFLAGYEAAGGPATAERVALHTAAGLVRLAVEPFRYRLADWPARTEARLDRAATLLSGTASFF